MQHTNTLSLFTAKRKVGIRWKNFLILHNWQTPWVSDLEQFIPDYTGGLIFHM